jgi:hypothetical protein
LAVPLVRTVQALYHPFFAVGVAGGELASNLYQEFAHLEEATDYARGLAEIAVAAQRPGISPAYWREGAETLGPRTTPVQAPLHRYRRLDGRGEGKACSARAD